MLSEQVDVWTPSRKAKKAAVCQQLERLLQNPHFHKSKRFPVFLKFVVNEALAGRADNLKERTLGIEVFGKDPNYDTNEDPIVRVSAGEIRKRIAQYYQEPGHEHEIRLLLSPDSYAPQFCFPDAQSITSPADTKPAPTTLQVAEPPTLPPSRLPWRKLAAVLLAIMLVIGP